jgi:hypothetical protein
LCPGDRGVILGKMRRLAATIAVCVLAAGLTVVVATGSAGGNSHRLPAYGHLLVKGFQRPGLGRLRPPVISPNRGLRPRVVSPNGTTCFVSSGGGQNCSLIPCTGFVGDARPDWVPITPECGRAGLQPRATAPPGPGY